MGKGNVILLPTIAAELELEITSLMQKKNFKGALDQLKQLLQYEHYSYNVFRDTFICLMKLKHTDDALELCEFLLLDRESEHYYDYLGFYIVLLYDTEQYAKLIEIANKEITTMPKESAVKTEEFKTLALQMLEWQKDEMFLSLKEAVKEKNAHKQYSILFKWIQQQFQVPDLFYKMLITKDIHPVIKTELFLYMQKREIQGDVDVAKLGKSIRIAPKQCMPLMQHPGYKESIARIEDTEQQDPVLYMHAKELIDIHAYVLYPLIYKRKKAEKVAQQALAIAKANLGLEETTLTDNGAKDILICQELYQEIML